MFLDKILESNDITEAKTPETKKNLQATSEELPTTKSDEHKCGNMGPLAQKVVTLNPKQPYSANLRKSSIGYVHTSRSELKCSPS